jgi:hypothetical protein
VFNPDRALKTMAKQQLISYCIRILMLGSALFINWVLSTPACAQDGTVFAPEIRPKKLPG